MDRVNWEWHTLLLQWNWVAAKQDPVAPEGHNEAQVTGLAEAAVESAKASWG